MEHTKIMPRHLLLLLYPVIGAILAGMLFSGNLAGFIRTASGKGISQAQICLGLGLLTGAISFSERCLGKNFLWGVLIFLPLLFGLAVMPQLGSKISLAMVYLLNLAFAIGLWLALRYTFFAKSLIKVRTAVFALLAALLLTLYFKGLYLILGMVFLREMWMGFYWNSLFLFIFTGFGLSLADIAILRKDYRDLPRSVADDADAEEEDDEPDDN